MTRLVAWLIEKSTDGTILAGARWLRQPERGHGQWTTSANEAKRFDSAADAIRYMVGENIEYARVVEHAWYPGTEPLMKDVIREHEIRCDALRARIRWLETQLDECRSRAAVGR